MNSENERPWRFRENKKLVSEDKQTWTPPKDWKKGVCQQCGDKFKPKLPKQFWCHACRDGWGTPSQREYERMIQEQTQKVRVYRKIFRPDQGIGLIRKRMNEKGLTYRGLAKKSGVDESTLRDWNFGYSPRWLDKPRKMAQALDCTLEELFHPDILGYLKEKEMLLRRESQCTQA